MLFLIAMPVFFPACVKTNVSTARSGTLSFNYNGKTHTIQEANFSFAQRTLIITPDDPGIFEGTIYFRDHCAYFAPKGFADSVWADNSCKIYTPSEMDSTAIFFYQSGSITSSSGNCRTETGTDILSGRTMSSTYCDIDGTFNLVLKNAQNKTMTLSDGVFHLHNN